MKRVLVLTDFSNNAWNALFTALKLFEKEEIEYNVMHCYEPVLAHALGDKGKERISVIYESLAKDSTLKLREIENYLDKNHRNPLHRFNSVSVGDDIVDAVKGFLKMNETDLIVMGTSGVTGARDVFMGSTAVKLIRKLRNQPVLAVPEAHDFKALHIILFPTDFSRSYTPAELSFLKDLATDWNSEIIIYQATQELRLSSAQKTNKESLENQLKGQKFQFKRGEMKVSINEAIGNAVEQFDADMIAMIHYKHTFMEKLTREPVVKKMAFYAKVPLLVLPETEY